MLTGHFVLWLGKGGLSRPITLKNDFEQGVEGEGQDVRSGIMRVVLGPCVQYCPCYCHHSICLKITRILIKRTSSKLDEKLPSYANLMFLPRSGIWPILFNLNFWENSVLPKISTHRGIFW